MASEQLRGKYYLIYFGFTFCPDICPQELEKAGKAVDIIEKEFGAGNSSVVVYRCTRLLGTIVPIFVTVDPSRDTCAQVGLIDDDYHVLYGRPLFI